jgi:hypothetical protein
MPLKIQVCLFQRAGRLGTAFNLVIRISSIDHSRYRIGA